MKLQSLAVGRCTLSAVQTGLLATSSLSRAQTPQYNIGDALRQSEETRRAPVPRPASAPVLPQLVEPQLKLQEGETVLVRTFVVEGPRLRDGGGVGEIIVPYPARDV